MEAIVKSKDETIKATEYLLQAKETELSFLQGFVNCRSLFEDYLQECFYELKKHTKLVKSDDYNFIAEIVFDLIINQAEPFPPEMTYTHALLADIKAGGFDREWEVYEPLVYRYPWSLEKTELYMNEKMPKDAAKVVRAAIYRLSFIASRTATATDSTADADEGATK